MICTKERGSFSSFKKDGYIFVNCLKCQETMSTQWFEYKYSCRNCRSTICFSIPPEKGYLVRIDDKDNYHNNLYIWGGYNDNDFCTEFWIGDKKIVAIDYIDISSENIKEAEEKLTAFLSRMKKLVILS